MSELAAAWRQAVPWTGGPAVADAVRRHLGPGWTVQPDDFWLHARPADGTLPLQGWKIHISARPDTAVEVCERAVPVLRRAGAAFKVGRDLAVATALVSARYERTGAGKFLTAYPTDTRTCADLLAALVIATTGLPGPRVVGDARAHPDAPVYYRFGVATGVDWLTDDGRMVSWLRAPDGSMRPDVRDRYAPPPWAEPLPGRAGGRDPEPGVALPAGLRITGALRQSTRGGVFTARFAGRDAVVKQARAHIGALPDAPGDARDRLRHEADVLRALAGTGRVPRVLDLLETVGSTLLVVECVPGDTLRAWVRARGPAAPGSMDLAADLVAALADVHADGWVLRDLTPSNVIVTRERTVRLVDLELAERPGRPVLREYTAGYAAPEQRNAPLRAPAPDQAADRYSLGALFLHLATGADPVVPPGDQRPDPPAELGAARLALTPPTPLGAVARALLRTAATERASLDEVAAILRRGPAAPAPEAPTAGEVLRDGLAVLAGVTGGTERLWPQAAWAEPRDPTCLSHGAAGPLLVLADAASDEPTLLGAVDRVAGWLAERLDAPPRVLPGLWSGRAGVLLALGTAARVLDDPRLAALCASEVKRVPFQLDPGLAYGAAGPVLAFSGCPAWHGAARAHLDHLLDLLKSAEPPDPGWATGAAGTGYALLRAGQALNRADAGDRALGLAARVAADTAPAGPDLADGLAGRLRLLLAARPLGGPDPAPMLARLAEQVTRQVPAAPPGWAHGLAGWGSTLLAAGNPAAGPLATVVKGLTARAARLDGRWVVPDDSGAGTDIGLHHGLSGVLRFLLRAGRR